MRGSLACLLLVGGSYAASIYLNPPQSLPSSLSVSEANAVLSHHLGLEAFESLADHTDLFGGWAQQESFVGSGWGHALLLTISEDDAEAAIPPSLERSSLVSSKMASFSSLVPTYLERARHAHAHTYSQPSHSAGVPRMLDIFSAPSSASEAFLSQAAALVDFLESAAVPADTFAALELSALAQLAAQHGRTSEQYTLAAETVRGLLSTAVDSARLKLAVVSVPAPALGLAKRQAQPPSQSPLPPPILSPAQPVGAVSTCYASAEACGNSTDACSGHGSCVAASKAGRTCFVCACGATKDAKGRTENWAGGACERKDVSGPFVLLAGTVVTLVLLVGGSVALLTAVGGQELPSTLTGGIVPTARRD
ncbi:hypothetical protein B0H21DRAFT_733042 [Amylocystis lapponica]|nr:hypothetical protein B0H21DRAFT_733042 [Amylocystis lapponica]